MYIPSHEELGRHPKTKRAARSLGVSLPTMVGHLQFLWWWALHYAPDGDITQWENADLADAALWEGDPNLFVDAITNCNSATGAGFIQALEDGRLVLHDWNEQGGGKVLQAREKHTQLMRDIRAGNKSSRDNHVTVTGQSRDDLDKSKVKESTPPIIPPKNSSGNQAKMAAIAEKLPKRTDDVLQYFEREATDLLGKVLTRKQRDVINGFRNELGQLLTVDLIDYAFEAAALHSGDKLAYVFQTIRNRLAGVQKPSKNGSNGHSDVNEEIPPDGYSWDKHNGEWVHKGGMPGYGFPYHVKTAAEVEERDEQEWAKYRRAKRNGS